MKLDACAASYWITVTVAPTANGCVGTAPVVSCQIVPAWSVANPREPVVPAVTAIALAQYLVLVAVPLQSLGPTAPLMPSASVTV